MTWLFVDGTVVELGGVVRGDTALAKALRRDVERVRLGRPPTVVVLAPETEVLDLDRPDLVDLWLRSEARLLDVDLASAPAFERPARSDEDAPEGSEY